MTNAFRAEVFAHLVDGPGPVRRYDPATGRVPDRTPARAPEPKPEPTPVPPPAPLPDEEDEMKLIARDAKGVVWVGDGVTRRKLARQIEMDTLLAASRAGAMKLLSPFPGVKDRNKTDRFQGAYYPAHVQYVDDELLAALGAPA